MFEIGSSLREARLRRGLELSQIERDTRIRAKYLGALEADRFDALPGPAYAKGFLRTCADYLGLDAQQFVDEYNSRFAPEEELPPPAPIGSGGSGGSSTCDCSSCRRRRSCCEMKALQPEPAPLQTVVSENVPSATCSGSCRRQR